MKLYLVVYNPNCLRKMSFFLDVIQKRKIFQRIHVLISVAVKPLEWWKSNINFNSGILFSVYNDSFALDFSAYYNGLSSDLKEESGGGVVFINDTFFTKHYSIKSFNELLLLATESERANGVYYVGPYRHSEYLTSDDVPSEFIATYMFYISKPGMKILRGSYDRLDDFMKRNAHFISLYEQYLMRISYSPGLISAKLKAFSLERIFTASIREVSGCLWFTEFGFGSRLRCYIDRFVRNKLLFGVYLE